MTKLQTLQRIIEGLRSRPGDTVLVGQFAQLVRSFTARERIELREALKDMLRDAS